MKRLPVAGSAVLSQQCILYVKITLTAMCSVALFEHLIGQCPGDQNLIGHGVLMMQKQEDTRLAENNIRCYEQNMNC